MALSNPYKGDRIAVLFYSLLLLILKGTVGFPLPSVDVKIVDEIAGKTLTEGFPGELRVKGPSIFKEYFTFNYLRIPKILEKTRSNKRYI